MKCNDTENNKSRHHMNLDNLDQALHDLDMLSAITEARREFLREAKSNVGVMRFNTRYVSNVTMGYCMRRASHKHRLCPYMLPIRHRTKSENSESVGSDVNDNGSSFRNNMEPSTSTGSREQADNSRCLAKRCQSLENLNINVDVPSIQEPSPDLDCVSTRIQKLQVDE